jgi:hypothetical protein
MKACLRKFSLFVLFGLISTAISQGANNDYFANRIELTGTNITLTGDNSAASTESGEPTGNDAEVLAYTLWYSFKAPEAGGIRAHISGAGDQVISVYHGSALNQLTPVTTAVIDTKNIYVQKGEEVRIAVQTVYYPYWSGGGRVGAFTLQFTFFIPMPTAGNDNFASAFPIAAFPYSFSGNIHGASREPFEPNPLNEPIEQTLWWSFHPASEGTLEFGFQAGQNPARILVYRGGDLLSLTFLTNEWMNAVQFRCFPDEDYRIQLGYGGDDFSVNANFIPRGTNDQFASSEHLESSSHAIRRYFLSPTVEPMEPLATNSIPGTLWWSWAPPEDGRAVLLPLALMINGSMRPANIDVFEGPSLDHLTRVTTPKPGSDRLLVFPVKAGSIYHIQSWAHASNDFELMGFSLNLYPYGFAVNDNFGDAAPVDGSAKSTIGATRELGEPIHRNGGPNKSLWWKWTCAANASSGLVRLGYGTLTNVTFAVYQGGSVDTLQLLAKGERQVSFGPLAGETYYIAAEVPASDNGDIAFGLNVGGAAGFSRQVPGNLVKNGSFEDFFNGDWSGEFGGTINEIGADGRNFARVGGGSVEQDIATTPGGKYRLQFVYSNEQGYTSDLLVKFGGVDVAQLNVPAGNRWDWKVAEYVVTATANVSHLELRGAGYMVNIDQVSLVPLNQPPAIVTQPESATVFAGASANFHVGITGATPMRRKWYFNGAEIPGATDVTLTIPNASPGNVGAYYMTASNDYGAVESAHVQLAVESASSPQIILQPQSDRVTSGQYVVLQIAAVGTPPLQFQWLRNDIQIPGETNATLEFGAFSNANEGTYTVRVSNAAESTLSLPATLALSAQPNVGGGLVWFANAWGVNNEVSAPVMDIDGIARISGTNFVAQLYVGPDENSLRAVGPPQTFLSGFRQGIWREVGIELPNVAPGQEVFVQARVWDRVTGASYESARALGGKFGRSETLKIIAEAQSDPPLPNAGASLSKMHSFSLRAGLANFVTGHLEFVERAEDGTTTWRLTGALGFRYLIEKRSGAGEWQPLHVLQNQNGTVTFTDSGNSNATLFIYRARILD